jgi:hypothetical protein
MILVGIEGRSVTRIGRTVRTRRASVSWTVVREINGVIRLELFLLSLPDFANDGLEL